MSDSSRERNGGEMPQDNEPDEPPSYDEPDGMTAWNYCPYCGEAVWPPAIFCCEEHEEGRKML